MTKIKREKIERFYLAQRDNLISLIRRRVQDSYMAEEIFHRVMFKCIEEYSKWGSINELTFEFAMKKYQEIIGEFECENNIAAIGCVVVYDPYEVMAVEERMGVILSIIDNMRTYNSVLKLYFIENYTVSEIAHKLDMKPNTVSKHIYRGIVKLKDEIRKSKYFQF